MAAKNNKRKILQKEAVGKPLPALGSSLCAFFASLLFLIALAVFSIQAVAFSKGFYTNLYAGLNWAQQIGVSEEDLEKSIFAMVDYAAGSREDMEETITWNGNTQSAFNEKEKTHMKDVRSLWSNAKNTGIFCFAGAVVLWLFLFYKEKKYAAAYICRGFVQAVIVFLLALLSIGMYAVADFTAFWTKFHHVFFTNDLWLLDPATDFMIVICPEEMFSKMIAAIVTLFGSVSLVLTGLSLWYVKKKAPIGLNGILR
jgi:integral membrane protein (TIGR01906 family)